MSFDQLFHTALAGTLLSEGRALAALARDPGRGSLSGMAVQTSQLAQRYGLRDERGVRATSAEFPKARTSFSNNKRGARCLECVASDPRVKKDRAAELANATDATRTTCAICDVKFAARNALFKHLRESGHGESAEGGAERAAKREGGTFVI